MGKGEGEGGQPVPARGLPLARKGDVNPHASKLT